MHNPLQDIDLVILDLDGTILDLYRSAPISAAVRRAIDAVQAKGIPVTIATGRTLDYVRDHVADLGIRLPVVTGQGAVIGDPQTGTVLEEYTIPEESARRAAAWIDASDYVAALYFTVQGAPASPDFPELAAGLSGHSSDRDGTRQPAATIRIFQNRVGADGEFYDHIFGLPRIMSPDFSALVEYSSAPPLKFIVAEDAAAEEAGKDGDMQDPQDLVQELRRALGDGLTITRTHPRLVEGTAAGVDKGTGVRRLCARLGIDPARVLAIGDSDNDIPMLQAVGFGVGMGNASPGVRAVAHRLAPSIDEDGVAFALRRWVLGEAGENSPI